MPIQRARMRIRITMPTKDGKRLKEQVTGAADTVEEDDFTSDEWEVVRPSFPFLAQRFREADWSARLLPPADLAH